MTMTFDSLMTRIPMPLRYVLAALVLCGLILAMVMQRAAILRDGREVRLQVVPVDPRDLFRGDYVVLDYKISAVRRGTIAAGELKREQAVFVTLRPDQNGLAQAIAISTTMPAVSGPDIVIAGKIRSTSTCPLSDDGSRDCKGEGLQAVGVNYGLESYFVPQGEGKVIETTEKSRIEVIAAVSTSGQAAIKRLLIDGKPVYDEPPY